LLIKALKTRPYYTVHDVSHQLQRFALLALSRRSPEGTPLVRM
jgi:hypothetical protein